MAAVGASSVMRVMTARTVSVATASVDMVYVSGLLNNHTVRSVMIS